MSPSLDRAAYLRRLGVDHPGPPSVASLHALHRAHVERIPYEVLEIQRGRPTALDPHDSAQRILGRRRGGYCYEVRHHWFSMSPEPPFIRTCSESRVAGQPG
jgi:arylamine N-acetyltransferase